jgi:hypothetical protein
VKNIIENTIIVLIIFILITFLIDAIYRDYHKDKAGVELTPILIELFMKKGEKLAWCILNLPKKYIENRTCKTKFSGTFIVHAGKQVDKDGIKRVEKY